PAFRLLLFFVLLFFLSLSRPSSSTPPSSSAALDFYKIHIYASIITKLLPLSRLNVFVWLSLGLLVGF
ncbi:hypothetical protein, partial [Serratia nevei]|uniref:hypothetical protein n=1 Tax=Serratia nevei TaxID=2703794 RepID=UPI003D35D7F0